MAVLATIYLVVCEKTNKVTVLWSHQACQYLRPPVNGRIGGCWVSGGLSVVLAQLAPRTYSY